MGTIGLSMAAHCRELIGVEIVPEAIESAKANAARMGADVAAKSRFFCADAGQAATRLAAEGLHPDIVMLDPPQQENRWKLSIPTEHLRAMDMLPELLKLQMMKMAT